MVEIRSVKEKTPGFRDVRLTPDGRRLGFPLTRKGSFSRETRFKQYDSKSQITGFMVGPGSYKNDRRSSSRERIRGTPLIKPHFQNKPT